jgi:molybdenum cofactor sulfurtransferase
MQRFSESMTNNLFANPHSTSLSAQRTSKMIEAVRLRLLNYFHADPEQFDLVFVANATAGIKLVAEAFREAEHGFWFGYHYAAHTSIVGVRELANSHKCFESDSAVEEWVAEYCYADCDPSMPKIFAYPAQSNMNGRRLPLTWSRSVNESAMGNIYTLLDAAAFASTAPLNLSDEKSAPDFTVLSLYKIFGFPDIGALIVKKAAMGVFQRRRYFGGGTVDMVACKNDKWYARKSGCLHEQLEDGSLPIHSIMALEPALDTHEELFGSVDKISRHCSALAQQLYNGLRELRHWNGLPVCELYSEGQHNFYDQQKQGPVIALNFRDGRGYWVPTQEVEKLASIKNIQLRTGGLCNPGGIASALMLTPQDMKRNYVAGQRCGTDFDVMRGRPLGMIRASLGPENTLDDVERFLEFVKEFFVENTSSNIATTAIGEQCISSQNLTCTPYFVESLTVYPIKSCSGWHIPPNKPWQIREEGLALDREWCVILSGTGTVMSQKRYPKMALIRPVIDLDEALLRVTFADSSTHISPITIPLFLDPDSPLTSGDGNQRGAKVCGDDIAAKIYQSPEITEFFTKCLGVPCQLGRFPPGGTLASMRHAKPHLQLFKNKKDQGCVIDVVDQTPKQRPILLSNESPILTISRASLNRLNEQIKSSGGKTVRAEVFRANIVVAESHKPNSGGPKPYAEDQWRMMRIGSQHFELLGPCRRCQMVCIDQDTGKRNQEPFVTLAKTRRFDGKVYFGQHASHVSSHHSATGDSRDPRITIGDVVIPVLWS